MADWAKERGSPEASLRIVSGLAANTHSIICDGLRARDSEWMSGSAKAGTTPRGTRASWKSALYVFARSSEARVRRSVFSLDFDLHGGRPLGNWTKQSVTRAICVIWPFRFNFSGLIIVER